MRMFEEVSLSVSKKGPRQSQESPKSLGSLWSINGKRKERESWIGEKFSECKQSQGVFSGLVCRGRMELQTMN